MEILVLFGLFLAAQHAWGHARQNRQAGGQSRLAEVAKRMPGGVSRSRRRQVAAVHGAGWWAGEALHGFPVHRRGWHAGWLAHQAAAEEQRVVREQHRTDHVEMRQSAGEKIREYKERQARAVAAIDNFTAVHGEPEGKAGREALREAVLADVVPIRRDLPEPGAEGSPSDFRSPWAEPGPYGTRRVDGEPETEADTRFFDERESGYDGPLNQDGRRPDMSDPEQAADVAILDYMREHASRGEDGQPVPAATNGGEPVPTGTQSETTYSQTNADFDALANEAEAEIARLQLSRIPAMIEALSNAGIGGGAMDALDGAQGSVEAQIKAAQEQLDYAQAAKSAHVREHGQGHEYHSGAENGGAERSYLQE